MNWFNNLKVGQKLVGGFLTVALLTLAVGLVAVTSLSKEDKRFDTVKTMHFEGVRTFAQAGIAFNSMRTLTAQSLLATDPAEVQAEKKKYDELSVQLAKSLDEGEKCLVSDEVKAIMADTRKTYDAWKSGNDAAWAQSLANESLKGLESVTANKANAQAANDDLEKILANKTAAMEREAVAQSQNFQRTRGMLVAFLAVTVLLSIFLGFMISRAITGPLMHVVERATTAATGDLTVRVNVTSRDELGQMGEQLNVMMKVFEENMQQVAQASQAVASASQQLGAGAGQISSGAQEQASSLEETAASLEEITSTVKQNADNAQQANQLANGSREVAEKGGRVVSTAVEAMAAINQSSKQIADIIGTIDEIAFQTNLLALNAAVEAARAGEQGRGFAVVATEVRNLAQRSATSAKEIKNLIQDSVRKVEGGTELVNQSGQTLSEIVTSVKRVTDIVSEIAAASREQSSGIDQVNKAVTQMDQVTQSNASQTEELNATAEGLASQAEQLQTLVSRFKLGGQGTKGAVARTAAKAGGGRPEKRAATGPVAKAAAPAQGGNEWEKGFEEY